MPHGVPSIIVTDEEGVVVRLLIAMPDAARALQVQTMLYARWERWEVVVCCDGGEVLAKLRQEYFDLLLLHSCLPGVDGIGILHILQVWQLICPPRILFLCAQESAVRTQVDCVAPITAGAQQLCTLLELLSKKPLPRLAAAEREHISRVINEFFDELSMSRGLKGRTYAVWILGGLIPSPAGEALPVNEWYSRCAAVHGTTGAAVERCLRVAVESVFTQGSMIGIERCFGATVDPEKGKPTNRAFLVQVTWHLRQRMNDYSFTVARSLNNIEMHHRPAAPTSV